MSPPRKPQAEKVLVFNSKYMEGFHDLPGVSFFHKDISYLEQICMSNSYFKNRAVAEKSEAVKQIIPYIIISNHDKFLAYQRSATGGEDRLYSKWSIGIGGHINPCDAALKIGPHVTLSMAINRELTEELDWGNLFNYTVTNINSVAIVYDDSDPVGRVHIGVVYLVDLSDVESYEYPKPHEHTIVTHRWLTADQLRGYKLENWSQMIIDYLLMFEKSPVSTGETEELGNDQGQEE